MHVYKYEFNHQQFIHLHNLNTVQLCQLLLAELLQESIKAPYYFYQVLAVLHTALKTVKRLHSLGTRRPSI